MSALNLGWRVEDGAAEGGRLGFLPVLAGRVISGTLLNVFGPQFPHL